MMAMKKMLRKIYFRVTKSDSYAVTKLFAYLIFSSAYSQILLSLFASVTIGWYFSTHNAIGKKFIIFCACYLVLEFVFIVVEEKNNKNERWSKALVKCGRELWSLQSIRIQRLANLSCDAQMNRKRVNTDVQTDAIAVCCSVAESLKVYLGDDAFDVVLFQQFLENDELYVAPIASGVTNNSTPSCMGRIFYNNYNSYKIVEIFSVGRRIYYPTPEDVKEGFDYINEESKKNETIKQYLAIPLRVRDGVTSAVLQICSYKEGLLPDQNDMDKLISDFISNFTVYFELCLEEQNIVEIIGGN